MKKYISARIKGKVQGVSFRDAAKEYAQEQELAGLVRNEADGTVYLEAEGKPENVDALIEWLKHGPSAADVDDLTIEEGSPRGFSNFAIEYPEPGYG